MKTSTTHHRCVKCSAPFIPDPRVGERQVTCGAEGCQRARHADQCQRWHRANRGATAEHYRDVVVPFRRQQPDYQARWRWGHRLGEIREQMGQLGGALLGALRSLVNGAKRLAKRAIGVMQTGVLAGISLDRAVAAVESTMVALEQLEASTAELRTLGL
jgi:hypothetical protein